MWSWTSVWCFCVVCVCVCVRSSVIAYTIQNHIRVYYVYSLTVWKCIYLSLCGRLMLFATKMEVATEEFNPKTFENPRRKNNTVGSTCRHTNTTEWHPNPVRLINGWWTAIHTDTYVHTLFPPILFSFHHFSSFSLTILRFLHNSFVSYHIIHWIVVSFHCHSIIVHHHSLYHCSLFTIR